MESDRMPRSGMLGALRLTGAKIIPLDTAARYAGGRYCAGGCWREHGSAALHSPEPFKVKLPAVFG